MTLRRRAVLLAPGLVVACSGDGGARIDADWHRQALLQGTLKPWLKAAATPEGAMRRGFRRDWTLRREEPRPLDLLHQARLVTALAIGAEMGGAPALREAALRGGRFLLAHFADPLHGGFFNELDPDHQPRPGNKRGYPQAFVLLALAELARAEPAGPWRAAALQLWARLQRGMLDAQGMLLADADREFRAPPQGRPQNPSMHLFEALLALLQLAELDAGERRDVQQGARRIGDFVTQHLLRPVGEQGLGLPEDYDAQWQPRRDTHVDFGHQFEWTHLLMSSTRLGVSPVHAAVAERVLEFALARGYDDIAGGCMTQQSLASGQRDERKGGWQQAECLHALLVAASALQRRELWRRAEQTTTFIRTRLVDTRFGGWQPGADCAAGGCPDRQPDPYHMAQMHRAALRLAQA